MDACPSPTLTPRIVSHRDDASVAVARRIAELVRVRPNCVLGLATGRTMVGLYVELARLHREEGLSFAEVTTFNLDEYLELDADHAESFRSQMRRNLFDTCDFNPARTHFPVASGADLATACAAYERLIADAGGIDLQLLGIGRNGHLAFNEPMSPRDSRTRVVALAETTRADAADSFGGLDQVPTHALTVGLQTIFEARELVLLAFGASKAEIVSRTLNAPVSESIPSTLVREHPRVQCWIDEDAARGLA